MNVYTIFVPTFYIWIMHEMNVSWLASEITSFAELFLFFTFIGCNLLKDPSDRIPSNSKPRHFQIRFSISGCWAIPFNRILEIIPIIVTRGLNHTCTIASDIFCLIASWQSYSSFVVLRNTFKFPFTIPIFQRRVMSKYTRIVVPMVIPSPTMYTFWWYIKKHISTFKNIWACHFHHDLCVEYLKWCECLIIDVHFQGYVTSMNSETIGDLRL